MRPLALALAIGWAVAADAAEAAVLFSAPSGSSLQKWLRRRRLDPALHLPATPCPCPDHSLCRPVAGQRKKEIFGFADGAAWQNLDWTVMTTVAWEPSQPALLCHAHAHGVRLIAAAPPFVLTSNASRQKEWAADVAAMVTAQHIDGVTFDYEAPMGPGSVERAQYTALVAATTAALHAVNPDLQASVCVPWSPLDIDSRSYDFHGLSSASDLLYVMAYDIRSQILDRCLASANSAFPAVAKGLEEYLKLGIPPAKLVLGVPWYGYDYVCVDEPDPAAMYCPLAPFHFLGVNCSDGIGAQVPYATIMARLDAGNTTTGRLYDKYLASPFFNYRSATGQVHQVWYDDPESLGAKYALAKHLALRGVGPFTFDFLDPTGHSTGNPKAPNEARAMWRALAGGFLPVRPPPVG